jgi:hypothetical protein
MIEAVSPGLEAARNLPMDDVVALDIEGQDSNGASEVSASSLKL